jgi:hypothetical protein
MHVESGLGDEFAAEADLLHKRLSTFARVSWNQIASRHSDRFRSIHVEIGAAIDARDAAGLHMTYLALNTLASTVLRGVEAQRPGEGDERDPLWQELRINETLRRLIPSTTPSAPSEPTAPPPVPEQKQPRKWWSRSK